MDIKHLVEEDGLVIHRELAESMLMLFDASRCAGLMFPRLAASHSLMKPSLSILSDLWSSFHLSRES